MSARPPALCQWPCGSCLIHGLEIVIWRSIYNVGQRRKHAPSRARWCTQGGAVALCCSAPPRCGRDSSSPSSRRRIMESRPRPPDPALPLYAPHYFGRDSIADGGPAGASAGCGLGRGRVRSRREGWAGLGLAIASLYQQTAATGQHSQQCRSRGHLRAGAAVFGATSRISQWWTRSDDLRL